MTTKNFAFTPRWFEFVLQIATKLIELPQPGTITLRTQMVSKLLFFSALC